MSRDLIHELDHSMPPAFHAKLGANLQALILGHNAILARLDALGNVANNSVALLNTAAGTNNVASYSIVDLVTLGQTAP